jgi:hypothetical protein
MFKIMFRIELTDFNSIRIVIECKVFHSIPAGL